MVFTFSGFEGFLKKIFRHVDGKKENLLNKKNRKEGGFPNRIKCCRKKLCFDLAKEFQPFITFHFQHFQNRKHIPKKSLNLELKELRDLSIIFSFFLLMENL